MDANCKVIDRLKKSRKRPTAQEKRMEEKRKVMTAKKKQEGRSAVLKEYWKRTKQNKKSFDIIDL